MGETAPNILVLGSFFDHLQALEDVHDVVDPPPLHIQVGLDLVQLCLAKAVADEAGVVDRGRLAE